MDPLWPFTLFFFVFFGGVAFQKRLSLSPTGVTSADDLRAAGVAERFGGRLDSKEETEATLLGTTWVKVGQVWKKVDV